MEFIAKHKNLYIVGGCVRDMIMGKTPNDVDYCFAGSEEELKALFPEAKMVGISFPVYMVNGCEVALTRTEESTGDSYGDFKVTGVGVPIEDDLNRRDFTMNQIAINTLTGEVVDPTNGKWDIEVGVIRTTNDNAFIDDPVRILRGLRFATTMGFEIDRYTNVLMVESIKKLKHVTKERIVLELEKMWKGADRPSRFFENLKVVGGLKYVAPVLEVMTKVPAGPEKYHGKNTVFEHTMKVVNNVKKQNGSFSAFVAALAHDFGKTLTPANVLPHHYGHEFAGLRLVKEFADANRFDAYTNQLMMVATKNHMKAHFVSKMRTVNLVRFVKEVPKHMVKDFLTVVFADHPPTVEEKAHMEFLFSFVNSYRMTESEVESVKNSKDKKSTVERMMVKHLSTALKEKV